MTDGWTDGWTGGRTDGRTGGRADGGAGVERPAEEQLGHHAPEGPHVYRLAERQAEKDLGSPEDMAHR